MSFGPLPRGRSDLDMPWAGGDAPSLCELAERLIRHRARFGISRIADITGLDRLGIPVVQAVRPLALSNAVSQGKGLDLAQAVISAVLEAAETFFAEAVGSLATIEASADELAVPAGAFERHIAPGGPNDWRALRLSWTEGTNILSGERQPVPLELVHTCFVDPPLPSDGVFAGSTTGLAAAAGRRQAIVHGLLEAIERDAVARGQRMHGLFVHRRIDEASIAGDSTEELLERVAAAGLLVGLWALEGAGAVPAIWCQLMESGERPVIVPFAAEGFAAHPDPAVAVCKAVTEAAQARLASISGARDDITRAAYPARTDWEVVDQQRRLLRDGPRPLSFAPLVDAAAPGAASHLDNLLARLSRDGMGEVIVVPLGSDAVAGIECVRVLVPALEPLLE